VGYWHGYLTGARCRLAYGTAVASSVTASVAVSAVLRVTVSVTVSMAASVVSSVNDAVCHVCSWIRGVKTAAGSLQLRSTLICRRQ